MKKQKIIMVTLLTGILLMSTGVYAGANIEEVKGYINHSISFKLNNEKWVAKDSDGKELHALIYEGSSYVPLKAIGKAVGADVSWDGATNIISINTTNKVNENAGIPFKDDTNTAKEVTTGSTKISIVDLPHALSSYGKITADPDKLVFASAVSYKSGIQSRGGVADVEVITLGKKYKLLHIDAKEISEPAGGNATIYVRGDGVELKEINITKSVNAGVGIDIVVSGIDKLEITSDLKYLPYNYIISGYLTE